MKMLMLFLLPFVLYAEIVQVTEDRSLLSYRRFSLAPDKTLDIQVKNPKQMVMLYSTSEASIEGTLTCNGELYLISPEGIYVGLTGNIRAEHLTLSTFYVSQKYFREGGAKPFLFYAKEKSSLVNLGIVESTKGDVILRGYSVHQEGTALHPNGILHISQF
jgi:filamentous hemagglutinin family protein